VEGQHLLSLDVVLDAVGCRVRVRCLGAPVETLVRAAYGALACDAGVADVTYVAGAGEPEGYCLHGPDHAVVAADASDFLVLLETELSIEVQKRRPDLFFLHAAALEHEGSGVLLIGASGAGKSTAAWGLAHAGFGYLSDELAPLDPETLEVVAYPRALCLKADPPAHPLPARTLRTARTLHVPPDALPGGVAGGPRPVHALFFVDHRAGTPRASVEPVTKGEAAARLLASALNPLAHPAAGLDAATRIASAVPAFRLRTAALPATAALLKATLATIRAPALR
jgi:hypothetical protein